MINWSKAMHYCYTRLYNNATPKAKWKELYKNAKRDQDGNKIIPFHKYKIEREKESKIIEDTIKKFKIKPFYRPGFRALILLGCSPVTKQTKK